MFEWEHYLLLVLSIIIITIILLLLIRRRFCSKQTPPTAVNAPTNGTENSFQDGIAKLHQFDLEYGKRRGNYYVFRRGVSARPLFSWSDHPTLITDAVENGWSRFGFTGFHPSPSTKSSLLGLCAVGDYGRESGTEISWEVCQGSADFMQKIRLNSGFNRMNLNNNNNNYSSFSAVSVIRTALPLPGPPLGNSAFPQEAYFEITILYVQGDDDSRNSRIKEGEKIKLIQENSSQNVNSESLIHTSNSYRFSNFEEMKVSDGKDEAVAVCLGLSAGGSLPLKLPGTYPGSIGFNSNGSVYLDGIKQVFESEKGEWAKTNRVIGCGYDPRQKKVYFAVDGELVETIHGKTEEFGSPLYPTIAANNEIVVLVNFGQSAFSYVPANAERTPNPCFIGPLVNSSALGYEDSKELFSMGRIDAQWHSRNATKSISHNNNSHNRTMDFDEESEADLFEIILEGNNTARSPNTVL
ncbi:SPla/RYanodine receptor (SPRY) domain-containing protein [Euphorbia peplus]|nr:SPla/RYanodine receptor (SPRY) domain-containing protein [Euphorbia peplus]